MIGRGWLCRVLGRGVHVSAPVLIAVGFVAVNVLGGCGFARRGPVEHGMASFHAPRVFSRHARTASGERWLNFKRVAAHRTLPFGTVVRVTNIENGRSVKVRIIDRGPYVHGRVIDLSKRAARNLRMLDSGVVRVRVEVISRG